MPCARRPRRSPTAIPGKKSSLRIALVERFKELVDDARAEAKRQLERDGDGRNCAEGLSAFQDALIRLAYDFTTTHVYPAKNPSAAEHMAVVAQGGYGRGMLAPGSDIDLLFLLPYKQTAWGESVAEYMLYLLWDLGFKVGHATRNIDQCVRLSHADMTIRTALLDARLILGDEALFAEFQRRFRKEVLEGNARAFIDAKLEEQNVRHARAGASRYLVEPNIKEGNGGLRDLHTLHWLAKHLYPDKAEEEFIEAGVFTAGEYASFRRCETFLWSVRCQLHFLTDRPEERLSFDLQQPMAERLHYREHARLARRRALHDALFPGGQGGRRADPDRLLGARDEAAEIAADARHLAVALRLAPPRQAQAHLRLPHRERPHQRQRQGRLRQGSGELHPPVRLRRRAAGDVFTGGAAPGPRQSPPHRRRLAQQPGGQPHVSSGCCPTPAIRNRSCAA